MKIERDVDDVNKEDKLFGIECLFDSLFDDGPSRERLDIAKRVMQGLIIAKPNLSPKSAAKLSLEYADAILEAL